MDDVALAILSHLSRFLAPPATDWHNIDLFELTALKHHQSINEPLGGRYTVYESGIL